MSRRSKAKVPSAEASAETKDESEITQPKPGANTTDDEDDDQENGDTASVRSTDLVAVSCSHA